MESQRLARVEQTGTNLALIAHALSFFLSLSHSPRPSNFVDLHKKLYIYNNNKTKQKINIHSLDTYDRVFIRVHFFFIFFFSLCHIRAHKEHVRTQYRKVFKLL